MSLGDEIALISLAFTVVTTLCALFLAYAALTHTVRPNIKVRLASASEHGCGEDITLVFEFWNEGHWYGSPTAVDITAFCNFDPAFDLRELRYGSVQEYSDTNVREGVGNLKFLKARGLKLSRREASEQVHVRVITPKTPGRYKVWISAYSANDASLGMEFWINCVL